MRTSRWACALVLLAAVAPTAARSQDKKTAEPVNERNPDDPGPVHKELAKLAGEYTTVSRFSAAGQTLPESTGSATIKSILGGRFLSEENSGEMMGESIQGTRLLGYDNTSKRYQATWAYTGSTALLQLSGTGKDEGTTITLDGSFVDEDGRKESLTVVIHVVDADTFVVTLTGAGSQASGTFETKYRRKK
jgi:uncharacterized protein DUF1579